MMTVYRKAGEGYAFGVTILTLSTLSLAGSNAYYLILSSTEHQKAYALLKYVPFKNVHMKVSFWALCKHFAIW